MSKNCGCAESIFMGQFFLTKWFNAGLKHMTIMMPRMDSRNPSFRRKGICLDPSQVKEVTRCLELFTFTAKNIEWNKRTLNMTDSPPPPPPSLAALLAAKATTSDSSTPAVPPATPPVSKLFPGGNTGKGGLLGALGGLTPNSTLKRTVKKKLIEIDVNTLKGIRKKTISQRFRELDSLHLYTPKDTECELLNLTEYRMNLHVMQDVLYLCGGLVGERFSSEQLLELINFTKQLSKIWNRLENCYEKLSVNMKKLVISSEEQGTPAAAVTPPPAAAAAGETSASVEEMELIRCFHHDADEYLDVFLSLQSLMRSRQESIDPLKREVMKINAHPENEVGLKVPKWLSLLVNKQDNAVTVGEAMKTNATDQPSDNTTTAAATAVKTSTVTPMKSRTKLKVGELSVYLGSLMIGKEQCNEEETEALATLVQASNDMIINISNSEMERCPSPIQELRKKTQKYWARRFYNFLSRLPELRAAIMDEKAIEILES